MLKSRTHFEQVPIEAVRKIVEEQAAREITIKQEPVIAKEKSAKGLLAAQDHLQASSRTYSQVR